MILTTDRDHYYVRILHLLICNHSSHTTHTFWRVFFAFFWWFLLCSQFSITCFPVSMCTMEWWRELISIHFAARKHIFATFVSFCFQKQEVKKGRQFSSFRHVKQHIWDLMPFNFYIYLPFSSILISFFSVYNFKTLNFATWSLS